MPIHTPEHASCWNTYSHIVHLMSLVETLSDLSREELDLLLGRVGEQWARASQTTTLDEVVLWAGIATGLKLSRAVEAGTVDPEIRDRVASYASLFAESTKSAVVEMTLRDLEE
jgi:hypothetical protein